MEARYNFVARRVNTKVAHDFEISTASDYFLLMILFTEGGRAQNSRYGQNYRSSESRIKAERKGFCYYLFRNETRRNS
jgi:hypothetical protein